MKIRVPVLGTVGKSVSIEADAPSRDEMTAAIAAAVANISSSTPAPTTPLLWRLIREVPRPSYSVLGVPGTALPQNPVAITSTGTLGDVLAVQQVTGNPRIVWTNTPTWTGNHTWLDSAAIRLGTDADFQLLHDGTDSFATNNTGRLIFNGTGTRIELRTFPVINLDNFTIPSAAINADTDFLVASNVTSMSLAFVAANGGSNGFRCVNAAGGVAALAAINTTNNTYLGYIGVSGYDGTAWQTASAGLIGLRPSGTWSTTSRPVRVTFEVTPVGSTTRTSRVEIIDTGQIQISDGDATLPGLGFLNDTNTGVRRIGADNASLVGGGVDMLDWTSARVLLNGSSGTQFGNTVSALLTNLANPAIYSASGSGSGDFANAGTLFIQPRSSAARDIIILTGSTSPTERIRFSGSGPEIGIAKTANILSGSLELFSSTGGFAQSRSTPGAAAVRLCLWAAGASTSAATAISIGGSLEFASTETWTIGAAHGTQLQLRVTANGASARATRAILDQNGQFQFSDGTAALPGVGFINDLDCGLLRVTTNTIALATAGSEWLRINATGALGLGGANFGTSGQVLTSAGSGAVPTWTTPATAPTGANPTASVGLTAVNGVATTFLRSDGAPALSQSISPTWSGTHTFSNPLILAAGSVSAPTVAPTGDSNTGLYFSAADEMSVTTGGTQRTVINSNGLRQVTGQVLVANGSASAPSFVPNGDNDTGFYFDTADQIGIALAGVTAGQIAQGTFTGTLTGMTASTTGTYNYQRIGKWAFVWRETALTGTSNSTAMTMTGLPSVIQPAFAVKVGLADVLTNNGITNLQGVASINGGTVTFLLSSVSGSSIITGIFTNSGTKGTSAGFVLAFPVA